MKIHSAVVLVLRMDKWTDRNGEANRHIFISFIADAPKILDSGKRHAYAWALAYASQT
jgi:hypothetical protein